MIERNRRNFSPDLRLAAARLVLALHYAVTTAINVGESTANEWVRQLKEVRSVKKPIASPMTSERIEIIELKKTLQRIKI